MPSAQIIVGAKAPAFSLPNADGDTVKLSDFAGKWVVVYFYPRADTPGCTKEACEFTADIASFRGMGADVIGISPDSSAALAKFRGKYGLLVHLLGDPSKKTMTDYGAWGVKKLYGKEVTGVIRSTVLIDPKGKIAHHWKSVKAAGHAAHVKARLADLRAAK